MLKINFSLFIFVILSFHSLQAMIPGEREQSSSVTYSLPKEVDQETLSRSSVLVQCGYSGGTGVAIGERWILTTAHQLAGHVLDQLIIFCAGIVKMQKQYLVPEEISFTDTEGGKYLMPVFERAENLKIIPVVKVHFHPATLIAPSDETLKPTKLQESLEKLGEVLQYGIESAVVYCSAGVLSSYYADGGLKKVDCRTYGPDIALLECAEPHGLPIIPLSDELKEERSLVHILGFGGVRYENGSAPTAGCARDTQSGPVIDFQLKIYGQRFKCLPASDNGLKAWMNRPFLRKDNKGRFIMEAEVFPNAPDGFGLISQGDSGAGCIVMHNGKPVLVGIVSTGQIESIFQNIHNILEPYGFDETQIQTLGPRGLLELLRVYREGSLTTDRNSRWFVTQSLTDVTSLKPWIESVIND